MFLWDRPFGRRVFRMTDEAARQSKTLAMNQGLYNEFITTGLIWGFIAGDAVKVFFLVCLILAGVFGAFTVNRRIFYIQVLPALLALWVICLS